MSERVRNFTVLPVHIDKAPEKGTYPFRTQVHRVQRQCCIELIIAHRVLTVDEFGETCAVEVSLVCKTVCVLTIQTLFDTTHHRLLFFLERILGKFEWRVRSDEILSFILCMLSLASA